MSATFTPINKIRPVTQQGPTRNREREMDPPTPHPRPTASLSETPERHPSSASPPTTTKTKRTDGQRGSSRRAALGSMGVHKRSGSGVGSRTVGGGGSRSQVDLVRITDDMTKEEKELAIEQNKLVETWIDERVRNNMSAKRSRLKKMMYIVDMDNTIKEYAHNVMEFKQAYDACKAVIMRHNLWSELGHAFVEPVVWQRPDVMREQKNDVADQRGKLEKEAEKKELYELGFQFAEKLRALVNKSGATERSIIAKALEEHRQKVEECARKEAQYEAQMKEHERKAAEMKVKIQEVQKQQAEYRIASEKYGSGIFGGVIGDGRAKQEDAMDLDPIPEETPAALVAQALTVAQSEEDPFVVQGLKLPSGPARQGAPKVQDQDDFADKGKTEVPIRNFHLEEDRAQKEFEDEMDQWAQAQANIINPDIPGSGYDGLPGLNFLNDFGFGGETQFFNPVNHTSQQQSSPGPINEVFNHGGNVTNPHPTAGNLTPSAYDQHWSANYQHPPRFSPRSPAVVLNRSKVSGHHGHTSQSHAQTQPQHQPANPVWDPMQNGDEHIFGGNSDA